jgi:hypothetical protein
LDKTLNNARNEGESFEDYKKRRRDVNSIIKQGLKGRLPSQKFYEIPMVWDELKKKFKGKPYVKSEKPK